MASPSRCAGVAPDPVCPSSAVMEFLGRRHMSHVLRLFLEGPTRGFVELRRATRAPSNVLSMRLRELVEDGVLARGSQQDAHPRVTYSLTPKGRALVDAALALDAFVADHGVVGRERARRRATGRAPPIAHPRGSSAGSA